MPTTDGVRIREAQERAEKLGLAMEYISKSRVSKYLKCPQNFAYVYLDGLREPENRYMRRGTQVHTTFEKFYENAASFVDENSRPPRLVEMPELLPPDWIWWQHTTPFISSFLAFEARRLDGAYRHITGIEETFPANFTPFDREEEVAHLWLPVEVEGEFWLDNPLGLDDPDESIPLMGFADAIYHAECFPELDAPGSSVVILDFKTGKTPLEQYRDEGIYTEGQFYAWLVEDRYNVAAVAGYYPKNDDLLLTPLSDDRRADLEEVVADLTEIARSDPDRLPIKTGPLCHYGHGMCPHYDRCRSTWGEPFIHEDRFLAMVDGGYSDREIADDLGTTLGAVRYAKKKLS
jgi:RecB family exonuclease